MASRGASLDRYYLFKLFGFGLFLHRIHHSDPMDLFHNHPWSGFSLIFGSYGEETLDDFKIRYFFNWIPAKRYHRVIVLKTTWTLFFHFPKSNKWSVIDRSGNLVSSQPWEGEKGFKNYAATSPKTETTL